MLLTPVVLEYNARYPLAVLLTPVVLEYNAANPLAVLLAPVVLEYNARYPLAVLSIPVVLAFKARLPTLVFVLIAPPPSPMFTPLTTASAVVVSTPCTLAVPFTSSLKPASVVVPTRRLPVLVRVIAWVKLIALPAVPDGAVKNLNPPKSNLIIEA